MIKVLADAVSSEVSLLGLQQAVYSLGPLCSCTSGVPWGSKSLFIRALVGLDYDPP